MKFYLAFVVAVIGVGMVAADENLKSKLQMALKSMLNENEELQMQSRDTKGRCDLATNSCNNHGTCTEGEDSRRTYYCRCETPYQVGGPDSSCYPRTYNSFSGCSQGTNYCDGHGGCESSDGGYSCMCGKDYEGNPNGGCSPIAKRATEVDDDDFTERKKEIMRQLAEFLQEE
ncbi:fibropellin-2 [Strongylocentrotus purpuratus]|uniref:EGF-like domain-containing protein n=1 Tax=Strongylocentrotus purpuratus TaxID=7668 RepID=A0A7M7NTS2_STRPU|nr:fibropellin-2 [Strongylocentrotus purpuratus]